MYHDHLFNWPVNLSFISSFHELGSFLPIKLLATKASILLTKKNPFVTYQSTDNAIPDPLWPKVIVLWGPAEGQGIAVLSFFIWLHSEVILFYPSLSCWCNSLNKKTQTATDRRRRRFSFSLYFLGSTTIQWVREFSLNTIEMVESPRQGF